MPEAERARGRRLFFALWPDERTRRSLVRQTQQAVRRCGGKPVPPENYHITLAFVGNVAADQVADVLQVGRSVPPVCLELALDRIGYWPRPRALWAAPVHCPGPLTGLVATLWEQLAGLGFEPESRVFQPHVTLCRKAGQPVEARLDHAVWWSVDSFVLVESVTAHTGPIYTVLQSFPGDVCPGSPYEPRVDA
jgi:2'-5' RNA ligase